MVDQEVVEHWKESEEERPVRIEKEWPRSGEERMRRNGLGMERRE